MRLLLTGLLLFSNLTLAEVYKCQGDSGKVQFQKNPCVETPNAPPIDLKLPSSELLLKMQDEAKNREYQKRTRRQEQTSSSMATEDAQTPVLNTKIRKQKSSNQHKRAKNQTKSRRINCEYVDSLTTDSPSPCW
jgi:hypothetical protein